jgi:hypothetical protein
MEALMVKKSLTDTWSLFKENVIPISLIVLPIAVPAAILETIIQNLIATDSHTQSLLVLLLINMLVYPIYHVATIFFIAAVVSGEKIGTSTLWRLGIRFWLPYTIMSVLFGLSAMAGFILLIVPGVILLLRWSFASFDLVLNQRKPYEALKNSWMATKNYVGPLLKGYLTLIVILYCPNILLSVIVEFWLGSTSISFQIFNTTLSLFYEVLSVMFTIYTFHIYSLYRTQNQDRDEGLLSEQNQPLV